MTDWWEKDKKDKWWEGDIAPVATMPDPADPNDTSLFKEVLEIADKNEVPIQVAEENAKSYKEINKKKETIGIGLGPMWLTDNDKRTFLEQYTGKEEETYPVNIDKIMYEVPKGVARFFESGVFGTFGGTVPDWIGQFIAEGGRAIDWFSKLGSKDKHRIYNPLAESIIATGNNISQYGRQSRAYWSYQAATGWEGLDPDLRKKDPVSYTAGRLSEGVASSGLSVLAAYLSGGATVALDAGVKINRGLLLLSAISAAGGFEHAQSKGENFMWSTLHGLSDGMVEYAMETSFLSDIQNTGRLMTGAKEGVEEIFTGLLQNTRAGILENTKKGMSAYEASREAIKSSLQQVPMEFAGGFIGGYGIAGGMDLMEIMNRSEQLAQQIGPIRVEPTKEGIQKAVEQVKEEKKTTQKKPAPKPAKPTAVKAEAKQPWEMTKAEILEWSLRNKWEMSKANIPFEEWLEAQKKSQLNFLEIEKREAESYHEEQIQRILRGGEVVDRVGWSVPRHVLEEYKSEPWAKEALQQPKEAEPSEVLAEYPELKKKVKIDAWAEAEILKEGRDAAESNQSKSTNPYKKGTIYNEIWLKGYNEIVKEPAPAAKGVKPSEVAKEAKAEPIAETPRKFNQIESERFAASILKKTREQELETDILGGIDPLQRIHDSLKKAKEVRPLTEAQQKAERKKRVGAAAGTLETNLKKGMSAEQALQQSIGLLKGPLTEYNQIYESIEDVLEPEVKNAARLKIVQHPDLTYFDKVNTDKAFTKLIQGASITPREVELIERVFGKQFKEITDKREETSDLYDKLVSLWKAGLLTGIKTHGLNIMANTGHAITETTKSIPESMIDSVASLFTGKRTSAFTLRGSFSGIKEGFQKGWKYLRTGIDERNVGAKLDYKKINFGKSKFARSLQAYEEFIFHLLGAADQPFYYGAKARSLRSQAIAQARNKGLKGKERDSFVNNLTRNPTDDMLEWAQYDAEVAVFQNRTHLGDIAKSIQNVKGGEIIVPFGRTPAAVATQIINYSPVGIVKEIAHEISQGKFDQRKFSQAFGRSTVGTGALYIGTLLFKAGLMTLDRPDNEREQELWKLEGRSANSIKIGDKWRSVYTIGPAGNVLLIGGYFQKMLQQEGSPTKAIVTAMAGGAKSFSEQTFVRGVNMAVDALVEPEKSFENWFSSMAGSLVPTIVADIARANDEIERRAATPKEKVQKRIPVLREKLPPIVNVFGQDLPRYGGNVLETMVDPTRPAKIRQDVVVDELRRLWDNDIKVSPTLLGDRKGYDILTDEENTQLWRRAGEFTYKELFRNINTEIYKKADDFQKGKIINKIVRTAKTKAKLEIVNIKIAQGISIAELTEAGLFTIEDFETLQFYKVFE